MHFQTLLGVYFKTIFLRPAFVLLINNLGCTVKSFLFYLKRAVNLLPLKYPYAYIMERYIVS